MTVRGSIRQSDLQRIFRAAKASGSTVQIDPKTLQVTVFPFSPPEAQVLAPIFPTMQANAWDADEGLTGWATPSAASRKGAGGYAIPTDPSDPIKKWYDHIGFDPQTMGDADMKRLMAENEARWKASIPGTKIGKREQSALLKLVQVGLGVRVWSHDIKGCGGDTTDRLEARGFIGREEMLSPDKVAEGFSREQIWLLPAGRDAAKPFELKQP